MPGQQMRRKNVRRKLNAMELEFTDKNVLIVDGTYIYFLWASLEEK
jgi:amidophosphoribosyltransferase